ncbi:VWA domain-containing protein [Streptomyces albipurpureus]|uniref:VWA domain-containing protein n=1 Tax=Streptomyces albipurpureus TaxID=2897419 RepID=A0ABT0UMI4_9ACTN|nr:vWA domain-containing protein [Streptomyces sp. CWNU-1]MCM2388840.1 VWA domain-containing protein [Streptomyces sp. CWNU-1]
MRGRHRRTSSGGTLLTALLLAAVSLSLVAGAGVGPEEGKSAFGAAAPARAEIQDPVDAAIVVDASGSLSQQDVERERDAAERIVVGEISDRSRMTVLGFASADNDRQSPVDEVCPAATLSGVAREKLSDCIGQLKRREKNEGTGTDFPSAIRQAVDRLSEGDPKMPRVLFLLTDGLLDVEDSPIYGDAKDRKANGERELKEALAEARAAKVQIWPLGFGKADDTALQKMAVGAYQGSCDNLPQAKPKAKTVKTAEAVGDALQAAFAGARCLVSDKPIKGTSPGDIKLRISPLATLASVVVSKGDPKVTVTYIDPRGKKVEPGKDRDGSTFHLTGAGKNVEALRITDPRPGTWTVRLDAPEGHRDKLASVGVQWRGALRSSITMKPTSPRPGESAVVRLRLQTRDHEAITNREDLDRLRVSASLTGDGFKPVPIPLAEDKEGGVFAGKVTVPQTASGALKVVGVLGAVGLSADHRPFPTRIAGVNDEVRAEVQVSDATVHPGKGTRFILKAENQSSTERVLSVDIEDAAPGDLTLSPREFTLKPGESITEYGTLRVGTDTDPRRLAGKIQVTDTTADGQVLHADLVTLEVVPVPSWLERMWDAYWWVIVPGAILLACLIAYGIWALRARRLRADPTGLVLRLLVPHGGGHREGSSLPVSTGGVVPYRFEVVDEDSDDPRLEPRPTNGNYQLRRGPRGGLVRMPGRAEESVRLGSSVTLPGSLVELRIEPGAGRGARDGGVLRRLVRLLDGLGGRGRSGRSSGQGGTFGSGYPNAGGTSGSGYPNASGGPTPPPTGGSSPHPDL